MLVWVCGRPSRRRTAVAHCTASLRMRLLMKLSDSLPVPTCSRSGPRTERSFACVCVCVRERERKKERERDRLTYFLWPLSKSTACFMEEVPKGKRGEERRGKGG